MFGLICENNYFVKKCPVLTYSMCEILMYTCTTGMHLTQDGGLLIKDTTSLLKVHVITKI